MRIGVMLRAYDRAGGIGIYAQNIVRHLLKIDQENHYILIYNNKKHLGRYENLKNVEEVYLPSTNPIIWDQLLVPGTVKKRKIDLIFNTKFSIPILTNVKKIMVLHGSSWFVHPELYSNYDIFYVKRAMPLYCRKADFLISNSHLTTKDFINILKVPAEKIATIHLAADEKFKRVKDNRELDRIKQKYRLPDFFILTVTSYDPRKNFSTLIKAFGICRKYADIHLVVAGKDCDAYKKDFNIEVQGIKDVVHFPGWIEQDDLPMVYNLASVFAFPSIYEEFGIPVVEAMACGCPVVSSSTGAIPELTQGAALLSSPFNYEDLSDNLMKIILSDSAKLRYREIGLKRANDFSWEKSAQQTINIFKTLYTRKFVG